MIEIGYIKDDSEWAVELNSNQPFQVASVNGSRSKFGKGSRWQTLHTNLE